MTERTPGHPDTGQAGHPQRANLLRWIPPVSALGTAFVLQVIVVTDTVGTSLADRYPDTSHPSVWYLCAALLGLSVASCVEGGAAYLMDLYDKHLIAGDSVWLLRAAMVGYVAGSGAVIHWWTGARHLPSVLTWLLAGMSASALFLWSRGSRWARREVMRERNLIDPAMPRLSIAAKVMHPVRWLVTLWLVSWEPADTPAEARARHDDWSEDRKAARTAGQPDSADVPDTDLPDDVPDLSDRRQRRAGSRPDTSVAALADTLTTRFRGQYVGLPKALAELKRVHGSCSKDRAIAAKDIHNARREGVS